MNGNNKTYVFDNNLVKTQWFQISFPDIEGRIIVQRKETIREQHNMGCTDGMKPGETQTIVEYPEIYREVGNDIRDRAVKEIHKFLKEGEEDKG